MSTPFIGEIRMFAGNFPPRGWAFCDGQLLEISQNDALFSLIGTTYGGDGQQTFALPDLRGRLPLHRSSNTAIGTKAGQEQVTLAVNQLPSHTHAQQASLDIPALNSPQNSVTGQAAAKIYRAGSPTVQLNGTAVAPVGGSQPHDNIQPFLCVHFIIALFGIFPTQ